MKKTPFKKKTTWKRLNPISQRRRKEQKELAVLRLKYMTANPFCERCLIKGRKVKSKELHHKRGRGIYYLVVQYFAALCTPCHALCKTNYNLMQVEGWVLDRLGNLSQTQGNQEQ